MGEGWTLIEVGEVRMYEVAKIRPPSLGGFSGTLIYRNCWAIWLVIGP